MDQVQCRESLRAGKRLLKEMNGAAAMVRFEKALMLSKQLQDKVAARLAACGNIRLHVHVDRLSCMCMCMHACGWLASWLASVCACCVCM